MTSPVSAFAKLLADAR